MIWIQKQPKSTPNCDGLENKGPFNGAESGVGMRNLKQEKMLSRLDEALLGFRAARKAGQEAEGWLRAVRRAVGVPVEEVARRLGVSRREVYRIETSEKESRIMPGTLRHAAKALDCELVYAVTPRQGTLGDLAEIQEEAREERRKKVEGKRAKELEAMGWRAAFLKSLRSVLRKAGSRVR